MPNKWKSISSWVHIKFDFTVDKGKRGLNLSREKLRQAPQKERGGILVAFLLCDPGWCVHK